MAEVKVQVTNDHVTGIRTVMVLPGRFNEISAFSLGHCTCGWTSEAQDEHGANYETLQHELTAPPRFDYTIVEPMTL